MPLRCIWFFVLLLGAALSWAAVPMETVDVLDEFVSADVSSRWRVNPDRQPGAEEPAYDVRSWSERDLPSLVGVPAPFWVRKTLVIPEHIAGVPLVGGPAWLSVDCRGHVRVYIDGRPVQDLGPGDAVVPLCERAYPGREIVVAMHVRQTAGPVVFRSVDLMLEEIHELRRIAGDLLGNLENALLLLRLTHGEEEGKWRRCFLDAVRRIDLDALYARDAKDFALSASQCKQTLSALRDLSKEMNVYAGARALLDPFGKETSEELVEVSRSAAQEVVELLERYPDLAITGWDARSHRWLEEQHPSLHQELVRFASERRYVLAGGAWTHFDPDLVSGEAIIRQYQLGVEYFEKVFGQRVRIATFPGAPSAGSMLPEFLSGCGMIGVMFDSIEGTFPWNLFSWQSPSAARILSYYPPHRSAPTPERQILLELETVHNRHQLRDVGVFFDVTGERRPSGEETIRFLESAESRPLFPTVIYTDPGSFFDRLVSNPYGVSYPLYTGRVNLAKHSQRFIQVPEIKQLAGEAEALLIDLERICSLLSRMAADSFPGEDLNELWRQLLSFHRRAVLTGIAEEDVLNNARQKLTDLRGNLQDRCSSALEKLAAEMDTDGMEHAVVVFNPLSWVRTDAVTVAIPFEEGEVSVKNPWNETVPSQIVEQGREICFLAENVPPLGYKVFELVPKSLTDAPPTSLEVRGETVATDNYRFTVDEDTGRITDLRLTESNGRILSSDDGFGPTLLWGDLMEVENVNTDVIEDGPVRARIRVSQLLGSASVVHEYEAVAGRPRIDVTAGCKGLSRSLGFSAKSDFFAPSMVAGVAGSIQEWKTVTGLRINGPVPGHDWAGLSSPDQSLGFALLTCSRTGFLFGPHELTLALEPGTRTMEIRAGLYPYQGDWRSANVYREAQELRHPLIAAQTEARTGRLPRMYSLIQSVPDHVVVGSVRTTTRGDGLLVRLWETEGVACRAEVTVGSPLLAAEELTLLDEGPLPLEYAGNTAFVPIDSFQVKTVRIMY